MSQIKPDAEDKEFDAQLGVLADIIIDSYLDKLKKERAEKT